MDPVADVALVVGELEREGGCGLGLGAEVADTGFRSSGSIGSILLSERMILLSDGHNRAEKTLTLVTSSLRRPGRRSRPGRRAALRPGLDRTADEVIDAIRTAVPAYARPLEGASARASGPA